MSPPSLNEARRPPSAELNPVERCSAGISTPRPSGLSRPSPLPCVYQGSRASYEESARLSLHWRRPAEHFYPDSVGIEGEEGVVTRLVAIRFGREVDLRAG